MSSTTTKYQAEIVNLAEIKLAVLAFEGHVDDLPLAIKKFRHWRQLLNLSPQNNRTFNLLYPPSVYDPSLYKVDLAVEIDFALPDNDFAIVEKTIGGGRFVKVRHIGLDDELGLIIHWLKNQWLSQNQLQLREGQIFFERVKFEPEVNTEDRITDVYLPVI